VTEADSLPQPPPPFEFLRTLSGRLLVLSGSALAGLVVVRLFTPLPDFVEVFRKVVSVAFVIAIGWLAGLALARNRRWLLWRVRRKLILSYVFLGFVPVVLVGLFALAGGVVLYTNIAAFVFREGFDDVIDDVAQIAESTAGEVGRAAAAGAAVIERVRLNRAAEYASVSLALVPRAGGAGPAGPIARAGAWSHGEPPAAAPTWVGATAAGFRGVLVVPAPGQAEELLLVIRAVAATPDRRLFVVADVPVDTALVAALDDRTRTHMGDVSAPADCGVPVAQAPRPVAARRATLFSRTVAFMDCTNWTSGKSARVSVSLDAPLSRVYSRVAAAQSAQFATSRTGGWDIFLWLLLLLGILFLVVQGAALVFGAWLARSITSAVHELFVGTERVRQGDFAHRIRIDSRDQLGDLAASFNRMSASIEHLLHVQREKQRLDDELRIARDIQKSLLPVDPPRVPGLAIADLCEPAREVGGDYYDFFDLGPRRLGVLVADVSGKGTSAALYMAELKGLMLALSHEEPSPRRLLVDVNRRLAGQLDNRSFVTMIYAVIDLDAGTLTCARAGHTPLITVSGGRSEVLVPNGMIIGLRLPGATERFEALLEEHTRAIRPGDVVVLYTDGITEAMNADGDLFSDQTLAETVASHHTLDPAGIRERVLRDVRAFVGDAEPHDDMTMVVLKLTPDAGAA